MVSKYSIALSHVDSLGFIRCNFTHTSGHIGKYVWNNSKIENQSKYNKPLFPVQTAKKPSTGKITLIKKTNGPGILAKSIKHKTRYPTKK